MSLIDPTGKPIGPPHRKLACGKLASIIRSRVDGEVEVTSAAEVLELGRGDWIVMPLEVWQSTLAKAASADPEIVTISPGSRQQRRAQNRADRRN